MKSPTTRACSSGTITSALGPLAGNRSRSTHRAVYQPPRPSAEIKEELRELEGEIWRLLEEVVG